MPKKKKTRAQYISKGTGKSVARQYKAKQDLADPMQMVYANIRRFDAYISGKRAYITIANTGANQKREPYLRVLAKDHFNNAIGTSKEGKHYKDEFLENRKFNMAAAAAKRKEDNL